MVKYFLFLTFIFSALFIPNGYSNTLGHTNGAVGLESNITNEAVIYIIKNGGGSTVDIFHDYEYLGAPAGRNIIKLFVAPGIHNLTAVVSKDAYTLQLDAVAGEEYYIYADPGEDQILFDARSDAKSNKDFHKDLGKDLDYLTPNLKDRSKASKKYQMYVSAALRYPGQLIKDEDSSLMQVSSAPITSIYSQEEKINAIRARKGKAPIPLSKNTIVRAKVNAPTTGTVYIVRNNGFAGSAAACHIFHNNSYLGKIKNKDVIKVVANAGNHYFSAGSSALGVESVFTHQMNVEAGKTYYLSANLGETRILTNANSDNSLLNKSIEKVSKASSFITPEVKDANKFEDKFSVVLSYSTHHLDNIIYSNGTKLSPEDKGLINLPKKISGFDKDVAIAPVTRNINSSIASATTTSVKVEEAPTVNITSYKAAQAELINTLEKTEGIDANLKWDILKMSNDQLKTGFSLTNASFNDEYESDLQQIDKLALSGEEKYNKFKRMQESGDAGSANIEDQAAGIASIIAEKNGFVLQSPDAADASSGPSTEEAATDIASIATTAEVSLNKRDAMYKEIQKMKLENGFTSVNKSVSNAVSKENYDEDARVKDNRGSLEETGLKYRRSSLYTLMINDKNREHYGRIRNSFGDIELSEKFNDHNVGPYLIPGTEGEDQTLNINNFLAQNNIAKELVAKWFNRSADGTFNMDLVAERGSYDASELDVMVAQESKRGSALLADAGEELIKNTFIVVYDYKYSNKEESAKKTGGWLSAISTVASYAGLDVVSSVADVANIAQTTMGKGYFVKTTAYLYKLKWDEEIASRFYNEMWIDESNYDPSKKEAFDNTDMFQLEFVGTQVARRNLQSSIFSSKTNEDLIGIATIRAADKSISKLQREYEQFRVKTPLLSGEPITAAIGVKEGLEKGDKFEVLEQTINDDGVTEYKRVGIIKVDHKQIWDNSYLAEEDQTANKSGYTVFKGAKNKFYPGMLIRQIK
ncbi:hypothetical protein [Croceibacter atlanticus]|uniref:hypothetical protein n=1 Tax=Croceibacter atlanticus TaxID=313588 RepID=UPI0030DAC599|tara:strand:- start:120581 stop:123529 length:2949 start_codon:yes stop_codon:yes gene_type:complete